MVPEKLMIQLPNEVTVQIQGRTVKSKSVALQYKSLTGGVVPVLFLDTDVEGNTSEDRESLFIFMVVMRSTVLKQEAILGLGGVRMLDALGFKVRKYHMNEGHSSL